jgi:hypothetical protein
MGLSNWYFFTQKHCPYLELCDNDRMKQYEIYGLTGGLSTMQDQ